LKREAAIVSREAAAEFNRGRQPTESSRSTDYRAAQQRHNVLLYAHEITLPLVRWFAKGIRDFVAKHLVERDVYG